jgi:hypothetical protein
MKSNAQTHLIYDEMEKIKQWGNGDGDGDGDEDGLQHYTLCLLSSLEYSFSLFTVHRSLRLHCPILFHSRPLFPP